MSALLQTPLSMAGEVDRLSAADESAGINERHSKLQLDCSQLSASDAFGAAPVISRAVTEIRVQKLLHEWIVKNFSHVHQEYLENFIAFSRGEDRFLYSVKIYPKGSGDNNKEFAFLCLNRVSHSTAPKLPSPSLSSSSSLSKNTFKCKFSLCNAEGDPIPVRVHPSPSHSDYVSYLKRETLFDLIQPQDVLVVRVEIDVVIETVNSVETDECVVCDSTAVLSNDFHELLQSGTLSDFVIRVGGAEIAVHRSVLAARSSVFRAMLTHDTEEARTNVVTINDFDVEVVRDLIRFLYTGRILDVSELTPDLLVLADKYDVADLKNHCEKELSVALSTENCCELLMLADTHTASQLRKKALKYIEEHVIQVTQTAGWTLMLKEHFALVTELVREMRPERNSFSCKE